MAVLNVLFLAFFLVTCVAGEETTILYVLPENGTEPCPTANASNCLTLNNYVEKATSYFLSDTTFLFLAGRHYLHGFAEFHNLSNIGLEKYVSSVTELETPEITCESNTLSRFLFSNVSQISIKSLSFSGCGYSVNGTIRAAISVSHVTNLSVTYVQVSHSGGHGLYIWNSFGLTNISYSNFTYNIKGGNLALDYSNCSSKSTSTWSLVTIFSSFFGHGIAETGKVLSSGIYAFIWCTNISLEFNEVTLFNNTVHGHGSVGGNMAIILRNRTNLTSNKVTVTNCHVEAGVSYYGGGIFLSFELVPSTPVNNTLTQIITIEGTNFTRNRATDGGGGLYIIAHEVVSLLHPVGLTTITDCIFDSNTLHNRISAGAALHVNSHYIPGYAEHVQPQYQLKVNRTTFTNSSMLESNIETSSSAVFIFQSQSGVYLYDCIFKWNNVSGLSVGRSNVIIGGEISFEGNIGINGGGILMCDRSLLYLTPHTNISFIGNHATGTGGGIYVSGQCLESIPECFFQFSHSILQSPNMTLLKTVSVYFENNTAGLAGSAIYGGSVDYCLIMNPWNYTSLIVYGQHIFDEVFHFTNEETDNSYITSDPREVCFCSNPPLFERNCSIKTVERSIYPGSTISVVVVVVGQRQGTAPGAVKAIAGPNTSLGDLQRIQDVTVNCTPLSYTVNTSLHQTRIELRVQHSLLSPARTLKINQTFIEINVKGCPIGFTLSGGMCTCTEVLANQPGIECLLNPYPVVRRTSYSWVGYHKSSDDSQSGIIYYRYCPSGYCQVNLVYIKTSETVFDQNAQCAHFRVGILCGKCPSNMSAMLGGATCSVCSNKYLLLIIAFAAAGVVLVAILNLSKLTVTSGEINGLIFYANIMQITLKHAFKEDNRQGIFTFISWLNLDLGIKTCFYNGMDSFANVFLRFVFPTYLFVLAFLIIFLCRKYQRVANFMGNNSVKVLATLLFLSYAKLLRIIISIFNVSIITYPDNSTEWRWTEDGSIVFARGKHLALVVCGLGAICFSLPYTAILAFHPCMQRSSYRWLKWIHRLKPLLDAYSGVYKDRYRFWTGLLLFARIYLFLAFVLNIIQDSYYKYMSVLCVCLFVLSLGWAFGGVYKDWRLDVLEASYIVNLAVLSGASLKENISQEMLAIVSVGVTSATLLLTLIWKLGILRMFQRVVGFVSQKDVPMADVPPRNISWFSISDHYSEGNDSLYDGENKPLLS